GKRNCKTQVHDWKAGCARAGCSYNFNVTGKRDGEKPAFEAYCSSDDSGYFTPCEMLKGPAGTEIAAELAPYDFTTANAHLLHNVTYNYIGHYNATFNHFAAPPYDFKVKPEQL
ncbi:hypothetical protein D0864_08694, partial [Hortaea werneckii]